jgi:hypothetical protein
VKIIAMLARYDLIAFNLPINIFKYVSPQALTAFAFVFVAVSRAGLAVVSLQ